MSPLQIKLATYAALALLAWVCTRRREGSGDVDLGIPTIDGVFGGGRLGDGVDYLSERPSGEPSTNPATNPDMRRLIDQSNRLIAEDDAVVQGWGTP